MGFSLTSFRALFVSTVIKGWDESVIDMSIGEVARIHCSPDYAYGSGGFPAWGIMPNVSRVVHRLQSEVPFCLFANGLRSSRQSELVFEIEILSYA
jgi:hypothetical protein